MMLKRICVNRNYQINLKEMLIWAITEENLKWRERLTLKITTKVTLWQDRLTWTWLQHNSWKTLRYLKAWCKWISKIQLDKVVMNNIIHKIINNKVKQILEFALVKNDLWQHAKMRQIYLLRKIKINQWVDFRIIIKDQIVNLVHFY